MKENKANTIYYNEEDRHRTIQYLIKNLPVRKQRIKHNCKKKFCNPINVEVLLPMRIIQNKMFVTFKVIPAFVYK